MTAPHPYRGGQGRTAPEVRSQASVACVLFTIASFVGVALAALAVCGYGVAGWWVTL